MLGIDETCNKIRYLFINCYLGLDQKVMSFGLRYCKRAFDQYYGSLLVSNCRLNKFGNKDHYQGNKSIELVSEGTKRMRII